MPERRISKKNTLSTRKWLFMAVILVFIVLLVSEIAARLVFLYLGKNPAEFVLTSHTNAMQVGGRYVSHPFLPFSLRPNSEHTIIWTRPPWPELKEASKEPHVWHIKTNNWGFRGREISMKKPANTIRIICLGGSTTYDTETDGKTWPEKLEALIQENNPTKKVQVLNFGMNASSLPFNIVQFALLGVHFKPDLVILYAGHNDLWAGIGRKGFRPDYSHSLGHWDDSRVPVQRYIPGWAMKSAFVTAASVLFDRLRGIEYDLVRQILRNSPPAEDELEGSWAFQNGIITIKGIAQAHGVKMLVITPHWGFRRNDMQMQFVEQIKNTARQAGIPLLDAANEFPVGDVSLQIDDVHFSDKGGSLFALMIADSIEAQHLLDE